MGEGGGTPNSMPSLRTQGPILPGSGLVKVRGSVLRPPSVDKSRGYGFLRSQGRRVEIVAAGGIPAVSYHLMDVDHDTVRVPRG
jgi:hypothetical protein